MATAGDGVTPYQSGGVGGKFRKRPSRRSSQATPYDRPPIALRNDSPSLFAKLVDPASRLIYAGADRLFGVFRKRLPSLTAQRQPETSEEPRSGLQEAGPISGSKNSTGVSEPSTDRGGNLTSMSVASEISELENMLKQKTFTRSEIERLTALLHSKTTESDFDEGDRAKLPNTTSHLFRLEASTSGTLNKHVEERENFHSAFSNPVVNSRAFEEDVASPADLAKAYMGTRPTKVLPLALRSGSQAPRQESTLHNNNTTIFPRTPITSSFKSYENGLTTPRSRGRSAIYNMARTPYYRGPSTLSQKGIKPDYNHGMASPSLVLSQPSWEHDVPIGSSKMTVKRRSSVLDDIGSGGPIRRIRQKANLSKNTSEIGSSAQRLLIRNEPNPKNTSYASVPTKSTEMASKIFEQLERMSPKEKTSVSRLAGAAEKSTTKVDSPKILPNHQHNQKFEGQDRLWLSDAHESTSQSKDKVEENGSRNTDSISTNGNSTVSIRGNASIVTNTDSVLKLPVEPPQKKRSFQMSADEESLALDDDNRSNGDISIRLGENKKPETSVFPNKNVFFDAPADVIQTRATPQVDKISSIHEFKKVDDTKTAFGSSVVNKQKMGFNFSTSPPSSSNAESSALSQLTSVVNTVAPQKEPAVFSTFGASTKSVEKVSPFLFSANEKSGVESNGSTYAKSIGSSSLFNSATNNDQVQFSAFIKDDNVKAQKSVNISGTLKPSFSASPTSSASRVFSFGGSTKNSSITDPSPSLLPSTTTTTTTSAAGSIFPTPVFSFGSAIASKDKEPNSNNISASFSSPAVTTTTTNHLQASIFNSTSVTQAAPFKFGSGSSAPSYGLGSPVATSAFNSGSSTTPFGLGSSVATSAFDSGTTTANVFGSGFSPKPSFGLTSTVASSDTKFSSSTSGFTASIYGSMPSTASSPIMFGSNNAGASTGSSMFSFTANSSFPTPDNNNDQMSMEDSMAEDSTQTPSPSVPAFGQVSGGTPPGFMFGSATQTPPPPTVAFQFGGQTNQPPSQNPFQASGGVEFNAAAGGSFSLGSGGGGGDKSGRRILRVKSKNRRK